MLEELKLSPFLAKVTNITSSCHVRLPYRFNFLKPIHSTRRIINPKQFIKKFKYVRMFFLDNQIKICNVTKQYRHNALIFLELSSFLMNCL